MTSVLGQRVRDPGSTERAAWAIEHADAGAESPLETLGRLACLESGLPVPLSNVWVGVDGPVFRVDHLWPWHGIVAEGDGRLKYGDRATVASVVADEKEREYYLRHELGLVVLRYGWDRAAYDRRGLALRFARALREVPRREQPVRWWPH